MTYVDFGSLHKVNLKFCFINVHMNFHEMLHVVVWDLWIELHLLLMSLVNFSTSSMFRLLQFTIFSELKFVNFESMFTFLRLLQPVKFNSVKFVKLERGPTLRIRSHFPNCNFFKFVNPAIPSTVWTLLVLIKSKMIKLVNLLSSIKLEDIFRCW